VNSDEAIGRLRQMLADAGVDRQHPSTADVQLTWQVMRRFASEPVEDAEPPEEDGDGILAQYGVYDWGDGEHVELDMTRQFAFSDEDGEYSHMSQLHCTFLFDSTDELRAILARNLWSFERRLEDFFEKALAMPGFAVIGTKQMRPLRLDIGYSEI
jgi:hypothetical protein